MAQWLVVDGNSIVNRAFYGVKALTTRDGRYTNAIVGFLNILARLREMTEATHIAVAFDLHAPTFRHEAYDGYKAGRKGMPDELREQMEPLKAILRAMGITLVEQPGYEADDILGTLASAAAAVGDTCAIATGDRDSLQLVGERVNVLLATTKMGHPETVVYTPATVMEKYGLTPEQLIDLKALQGDASDNIPGVPGVGEKTALDLMQRFGSLDAIYEHLDTLDIRDSLRAKLAAGKESAYMSRMLGTICRQVPMDTTPAGYTVGEMHRAELASLLQGLELYKWMDKLGLTEEVPVAVPSMAETPAISIGGNEMAAAILQSARQTGQLDVLAQVEGEEIVALSLGCDGILAHVDRMAPEFEELLGLLSDAHVIKRTHDGKPLYAAMLSMGVQPEAFTLDTALAAYLLDPLSSSYDLIRLLRDYGIAVSEGDEQGLSGFGMLADRLLQEVTAQDMLALLSDVEMPLSMVLASMELVGCAVDKDGIAAFGRELTARIAVLQQEIFQAVGYEFNLNSPKQLGKALFEDLGLPAGKKTKSGYSTNAEVLEKLKGVHPAVEKLLEYRTLSKLNGTYCEGLLKVIAPDGRIHSVFNQTETRTGRISSSEPNLQNIPVRSELGRQMRRFFPAREGWVLCDADYSQIELRVLAHMADEPTMLQAFNTGEDIHRSTAAQVFGVSEQEVTPQMRSSAKAVNFGIIYGIGAHSLSEDIGVTYGEAKAYIDRYLHHFGAVSAFMDKLIIDAADKGYAQTLFGRRRPLPELKAGNAMTRKFGERVARNMPIQGTAADIIKIAMVRVYRRLQQENMQARLILQIHDELMVEAPANEAERAAVILREEMEAAATLRVRLEVDVHHGRTWYDAKG
ncbi:MAG: DNA polymerase I [Ruminococcaceae bacterium]|nr:DNA polymerase I [Oscillospiraceae bacterium]